MAEAKFDIGQVVRHRMFDYRGVVFDVDPVYSGTDDWYRQVALSRPPKNAPWYHVMVHDALHTTYVAERNLEPEPEPGQIAHPDLGRHFSAFDGVRYLRDVRSN
ncbi:MAG: heat shock protein HspQ [Alphaproteobacteria bacterium]|nr:heat shock protein HspQ [Alphaproteobacteria bacterium]